MFERIKAYNRLRKSNEFLKGCKIIADLQNDDQMLKAANEALYKNEILKRKMWYKRKMAVSYNLESIKKGL